MKNRINGKGFSLMELMIVVAIIAIIVTLALPSFTHYVRKANRGEAQQLLLNWANNQEIWRANDTDYASEASPVEIPVPTHDRYTFSLSNRTATTYTLIATANGDQANDTQRGTSCTPLRLNQANAKEPQNCW